MTLAEYKAWLDGMIAATDDDRLKAARAKVEEVVEPLNFTPFTVQPAPVWPSPSAPAPWRHGPYTTCGVASVKGYEGATSWNGRLT